MAEQGGAGNAKTNRRRQRLAIIALAIITASIVSILICTVLIGNPHPRAPERDFDYADLLIVEEIAPSNWMVDPMSSGRTDGDSYYDYYFTHHYEVSVVDGKQVFAGYTSLYYDDRIDPTDFLDFTRHYINMADGPAPDELIPAIEYADQWDIGCEVIEILDSESCKFAASYQEVIFTLVMHTKETLRFDDLPEEIMAQIVGLIETQDRHIGEMMGMDG
ncbi:MAG: hypothetical protein JXJ17_00175 [Anaerolineae bacterium]|nr:hypothetical protein [Anaerolineae bacterium]